MSAFVDDTDFTLYVGDVREVLASLPAESVHCCVTSPPYWGLRDYGTGSWHGGDAGCDHDARQRRRNAGSQPGTGNAGVVLRDGVPPNVCKCGARRVDHQLGLEPTPEEYVDNMVSVFREVRRVLRRDGTCWLNIGDSYNTLGPKGPNGQDKSTLTGGGPDYQRDVSRSSPVVRTLKTKDLVGIPWRLAFALQADGWYLRSDIIWSKPNPMPESVTDRPTKAHEYLFLLTRSARYFYDADAIREPNSEWTEKALAANWERRTDAKTADERNDSKSLNGAGLSRKHGLNPAGRNKRSVWEIATQPYPDAHFATFPQALVEPCVLAGTSERGCCPECGAPWERVVETGESSGSVTGGLGCAAPRTTSGWRRTCDHDWQLAILPCTVLDPFMGSGTTAVVARRLGRKSLGIELNAEYAKLATTRLQQLSLLGEGAA